MVARMARAMHRGGLWLFVVRPPVVRIHSFFRAICGAVVMTATRRFASRRAILRRTILHINMDVTLATPFMSGVSRLRLSLRRGDR